MEKLFIVKNNITGRSYPVTGNENTSLEMVWKSQKCWLTTGNSVTITDENGNSQVFVKEGEKIPKAERLSIKFEFILDGAKVCWKDLDEHTQERVLETIKEDFQNGEIVIKNGEIIVKTDDE